VVGHNVRGPIRDPAIQDQLGAYTDSFGIGPSSLGRMDSGASVSKYLCILGSSSISRISLFEEVWFLLWAR
jgi:hypothetical protein